MPRHTSAENRTVKPFLLFAGKIYYPLGGAKDFICSFDTLEQAVEAAPETVVDEAYIDWAHITDGAFKVLKHGEYIGATWEWAAENREAGQ